MNNFSFVLKALEQERGRITAELERLNSAIAVLKGTTSKRRGINRVARRISVAARNRIAAAQRARWAKWRKMQKAA